MNWTEGKLARHSRARQSRQSKQTLLRQKEHFAKARAGLLPDTSKQGPSAFPLFPSATFHDSDAPHYSPLLRQTRIPSDIAERPEAGKRPRSTSSPKSRGSVSHPHSVHHAASQGEAQKVDSLPTAGVDGVAIRAKRQKLLRAHDWAGISIQKPIPVNFERRSPNERKWSRRQSSTARRTRHLIRDRFDETSKIHRDLQQPHRRKQDMRITVGSQEVCLGQGSSVRRYDHTATVPETRRTYGGVTMPGTFWTSSSSVTDPKEKLNVEHGPPARRHSSLTSISESSRSHHAKDDSGGRRHLKAPIPIRPFPEVPVSLLDKASDRDTSNSMLAQVGGQVSPIPTSQLEDNEVWRRFAALSQSNAGNGNSSFDQLDRYVEPRISPGVSARQHQTASTTVSLSAPNNSDIVLNAHVGHQRTSPYYPRQWDGHRGPSMVSTDAPSTSHTGITVSSDCFMALNHDSGQSEPENMSHECGQLIDDSHPGHHHDDGDSLVRGGSAIASPFLESFDYLSAETNSEHDTTSGSMDSATGNADQHVARHREVALNLVSRRTGTPWRNEGKGTVDRSRQALEYSSTDSSRLYEPTLDARLGRPVDAVREVPPKTNPDDIWFRYVFSDVNTDDLHKQVLAESRKDSPRNVQVQMTHGGSSKTGGSECGHDISTAATPRQLPIDVSETGDDLASASAVSASHKAAIGSPVTTRTTGTVFHGLGDTRGPPYAAPSLQASTRSDTTRTYTAQQDGSDSGSGGQGRSQGITNTMSSFSSNAVEHAQSVTDTRTAKESFRFAPPKLFVGKLSETVSTDRDRTSSAVKPVTMTKPKRGRPKKKARDGRANIKSIPVYHDDPIEEFDEHGAQPRFEPSLFGALDTE